MENRLTGVYTALVTPFKQDQSFDEAAMRRLVDLQLEAGIAGVVPCGTTGESACMTTDEWERILSVVVEQVAGRVPVFAGTGSNYTGKAVDLSRRCARIGIDILLHVTPYYVKPTQRGMMEHYRAITDAVDRPIVLYNVPGRTGVTLTPDTVLRLAENPRIIGIKQAVADLDQVSAILQSRPPRFAVLSGEDSLTLPMVALGADGVISVVSNEVPVSFTAMVRAALEGRREEAASLHRQLFPLMKANFVESNPIPVKYALAQMGLVENVFRLPMTPLADAYHDEVKAALRQARAVETAAILRRSSAAAPAPVVV